MSERWALSVWIVDKIVIAALLLAMIAMIVQLAFVAVLAILIPSCTTLVSCDAITLDWTALIAHTIVIIALGATKDGLDQHIWPRVAPTGDSQ